MKKKGRKPKAINIVKLTEHERKKFTKKYHCKRCHDFFVDTKEELEHHKEELHGEYSLQKHLANKNGDKKLKKIYLNRNKVVPKSKEQYEGVKLKPTDCFVCWCKDCGKIVAIHMDLGEELQDDIICPNCRANIFIDETDEIVEFQTSKGMTPIQFRNEYGIDTTLFKRYEVNEMKLKSKGRILEEFVNRRNGKK